MSCSPLGTVCRSLALSCSITHRFSVELASVLFPGQTSSTQKKSRLLQLRSLWLQHQFCAFLVVRKEFPTGIKMALKFQGQAEGESAAFLTL